MYVSTQATTPTVMVCQHELSVRIINTPANAPPTKGAQNGLTLRRQNANWSVVRSIPPAPAIMPRCVLPQHEPSASNGVPESSSGSAPTTATQVTTAAAITNTETINPSRLLSRPSRPLKSLPSHEKPDFPVAPSISRQDTMRNDFRDRRPSVTRSNSFIRGHRRPYNV